METYVVMFNKLWVMKLCTFCYTVKAQNKMQCVSKLAHALVRKFRLNELEGVKCKKIQAGGKGDCWRITSEPLPTKLTTQHANFENIHNIRATEKRNMLRK